MPAPPCRVSAAFGDATHQSLPSPPSRLSSPSLVPPATRRLLRRPARCRRRHAGDQVVAVTSIEQSLPAYAVDGVVVGAAVDGVVAAGRVDAVVAAICPSITSSPLVIRSPTATPVGALASFIAKAHDLAELFAIDTPSGAFGGRKQGFDLGEGHGHPLALGVQHFDRAEGRVAVRVDRFHQVAVRPRRRSGPACPSHRHWSSRRRDAVAFSPAPFNLGRVDDDRVGAAAAPMLSPAPPMIRSLSPSPRACRTTTAFQRVVAVTAHQAVSPVPPLMSSLPSAPSS